MKVEQRPSHFTSRKIRKLNPVTQKPIPDVISSESFLKSIALLSQLEYKTAQEKRRLFRSQCSKCKDPFFTPEGKDAVCKACNEVFCLKHRELDNHQCAKVLPSYEKYLMAKNLIKNKLREVKSKGY